MAGYDDATSERPSQTSVNPAPKSVRMWDVFRPHILDWILFILILAGGIAIDSVHPFQQFVNADYMQKYMYPLKTDSVPFWAVPVYALGFPLLAIVVSFILRRDFVDFHSSLLGFVFSSATTFLLTNAIKVSIGRPRPHFFIVCFPSGVPVYGSDGNAQCNGTYSKVMESRLSFPSGHTSMSFAGLTYAALFLAAKLQTFSAGGRGRLWLLAPSACCLAGATSVAITRVDDYWHFPFDVFIGGLLGMVVAAICYFLHYPALSNQNCDIPLLSLGPDAETCQVSCCGARKALASDLEPAEPNEEPNERSGV